MMPARAAASPLGEEPQRLQPCGLGQAEQEVEEVLRGRGEDLRTFRSNDLPLFIRR